MLISEIMGWHWVISWDNPDPANSKTMYVALEKLGKVTRMQTKTACMLAPKAGVTIGQIRHAITSNLQPRNGNAYYVNLRTGNTRQYVAGKNPRWKKVV